MNDIGLTLSLGPAGRAKPPRMRGENATNLTRREMEILALMADGNSNDEISVALEISGGTVRFHVKNVIRKLAPNSRTRTEAAVRAVRMGIIP